MALKQIPIASLKIGMHITKLDIPWMDSPFVRHHLTIKSEKDLKKLLKAGVKKVTIDTMKGEDVAKEKNTKKATTKKSVDKKTVEENKEPKTVESVPIEQELNVAKALMDNITTLSDNMNQALKNDQTIELEHISPLIEGTLQSLGRNNQAMTTLVNMQRKASNLANHAFATFSLALNLSIKMELDAEAQHALGLAALLHDTGWLKLPLHLLGKSSRYNDNEVKLTEQHIAIGYKLLKKNCDLPDLSLRIIEEHHEYCNGSGYPKRLSADKIHTLSKLFSVIDLYDELVHGLIDKPAITPHGALSYLYKMTTNNELDESIVTALVSVLSIYPVGSIVQLNNKEKGLVFDINHDHPKQPKVRIYYDVCEMAHAEPRVLDLANQKSDSPLEVIKVLDLHNAGVDPAHLMELS